MTHRQKQREHREVEIDVTSIGAEGVSVGRVDGVVHFVKGALPGEHVRAVVRRQHRRYVDTEVVEVIRSSPDRIEPPCEHFGICGGCSWQHLMYEKQLQWKSGTVHDALQRIGGIETVPLLDPIGSGAIYAYRNKMEFSFSSAPWLTQSEIDSGEVFDRTFALGLHVPGRYDKVRHLQHCHLQSDAANKLLENVHNLPQLREVPAYNHREHVGFLRHLVIRSSSYSGAIVCVLITTQPSNNIEEELHASFLALHKTLPENSTLIVAVNNTHSPVATGEIIAQLGPGFLEERTHEVTYRISPFSFFQTNTQQMHSLVALGLDAAQLTPNDVAWDLYCGTGTLTLPAARRAKKVVGAELVQSSIDDARSNALRNDISNVEFHAVDLHAKHALDVLRGFEQPDAIIIDPPRSGMHPQVVEHLLAVAPPRISYVSCNPSTMARDVALMSDHYEITWVRAIDMFPQTSHVEAVAALSRRY